MFKPEDYDDFENLLSGFDWQSLISNPNVDNAQNWVAKVNGSLWDFDSPSANEFAKKIDSLVNMWSGVNAGTLPNYDLSYDVNDIKQFLRIKLEGMKREKEKILEKGTGGTSGDFQLEKLHPVVYKKCESLFKNKEYSEAVEKGFKVVRDRLRELTGYETGSEAFGRGKLHIKGAAAQHVDADFNEGVKFLTMAIDRFRNEKSHTADGNIDNPQRAYEYLALCSLAMHLLENSEIVSG